MDRLGKQEFVETFEEIFDRFPCMVVVRQVGLDASTTVQLRKEAREAGATFQVVKNRLAKRALHGSKEDLLNAFKGPTGVFFSEDPVSLAKFIANFSKKREEKFFALAGLLEGKFLRDQDIRILSTLPSLDQLRTQVLGVMNAPAIKVLGTIQEVSSQLVRVIKAYGDGKGMKASS